MVEYKEKFLDKMKKLLSYLIKFSKDRFMISKKYLKDFAIGKPNKQLVIIIIYNESTFLANNS